MQSHPVYFLFPTLPIPESHRIRISTVIKIITIRQICHMPFFLPDNRQLLRQLGFHLIPGKMNTCIIFQIPVNSGTNVHIIIPTNHHFITLLLQFKKVFRRIYHLNLKFTGSTLVYPLQKTNHRICPDFQYKSQYNQ